MIPFADYALLILNRIFPQSINTRAELLEFMQGDMSANILWTEYIEWHCALNPANRAETFHAWLHDTINWADCTVKEWSFVCDIRRDADFPVGNLDKISEYLLRYCAHPSTFDSLESLWIKYHYSVDRPSKSV